ncbi:hypothetical protein LZ198_15530 [Myxococcus sp. K15C18031901]|uniref:hypothetical protein n=1 Tax=Myxococcus dinghuensis TaxID=2906761 RepID=UPI0020A7EB05|nr:hypothetical protein [Myxococcus dinghuensis]MCP3100281.1 hypothetical protein [Myxococcus dinghuensis]
MAEPVTVTATPPANKGMDYVALKEEGTRLVQQLAGNIWTDYNEHDPGVTTLEQVCYALTELSYRAQFPLEDLLLDPVTGQLEPERQALFPALDILPCNPVTERDYRKLLLDRVPGLANVWLTPVSPSEEDPVPGLHDLWLYAPGADCCASDDQGPEALIEKARRVYSRHRDLCEDLRDTRLLQPVTATVTAEVSIDERLSPESILAALFFNLGNRLAPEPRRESLSALLAAGRSTEDIFEGPLMLNGFIADAELQPKATSISIPDLLEVMVVSPGVTSVRRVSLRVGDTVATQPDGTLSVPVDQVLALDTRSEARRGGFSIRLFRNGVEVKPQPARVRRELERLWAEQRRTWPLRPQYTQLLPMPQGQRRDFRRYTSIQNQYPLVYGISAAGLPDVTSPVRRAQAKQLKGYLLVFEQLLADFFAQLERTRDLFSTDEDLRRTYFFQLLTGEVPDVEPLLKHGSSEESDASGYARGLAQLVASQDPVTERRNRFLDVLLALFAESLDIDTIAGGAWGEGTESTQAERLMEAKLALLRHLVHATQDRGRGIDYLERPGVANIAGMAIKSRIQLGMDLGDASPLIDVLDELFLDISDAGTQAPESRALARHTDMLEERFTAVSSLPAPESLSPEATAPLRSRSVSAEFLGAAGSLENLRVGTLPGESSVSLVSRSPGARGWHLVGKFANTESAVARAHGLVEQVRRLNRRRSQLYIVEHLLLRSARRSDEDTFAYGFTLTAVISTATGQWKTTEYQSFAREVIRSNAPALVVTDCLFLGPTRMAGFERLYWAWRNALRDQDPSSIATTSARLRDFLEVAAREPEADGA